MPDRSVVLAVVIGLLGIVAACVAAITVLVALNEKLPDVLAYLATTAVGAVAGILSRTTTEPQTVTVVQPAEKPVPVTPAPEPAAVAS